jgi:hypothetical protein
MASVFALLRPTRSATITPRWERSYPAGSSRKEERQGQFVPSAEVQGDYAVVEAPFPPRPPQHPALHRFRCQVVSTAASSRWQLPPLCGVDEA